MEKALVESVLRLTPADRMRLLEVISGSLERPDDTIDEIWYDEAERRLAAHRAGEVEGTPIDRILGGRSLFPGDAFHRTMQTTVLCVP